MTMRLTLATIVAALIALGGLAAGDTPARAQDTATYSFSYSVDRDIARRHLLNWRLDWLDDKYGATCVFRLTATRTITIEEGAGSVIQTVTETGNLVVYNPVRDEVEADKPWEYTETMTVSGDLSGIAKHTYMANGSTPVARWFIKPGRKALATIDQYDGELRVGTGNLATGNLYHWMKWTITAGLSDVDWQSYQSNYTGGHVYDAKTDVYVEGDDYTPLRLSSGG